MILTINTKDQKKVIVGLKKDQRVIAELFEENQYGSQVLLPLIIKLLSTKSLSWEQLTGVEVESGPGSFTGLRVGAAVAQALGFSLNIPINGQKIYWVDLKYS